MTMIILFTDLDDTLFQTQRKNPAGVIPATENVATLSYMTPAQARLLRLFSEAAEVKIIPVTARDERQYHNTLLSQRADIQTAAIYFGGLILEQGQPDPVWQQRVQQGYAHLSTPLDHVWQEVQQLVPTDEPLKVVNVDDYYITVRASRECPTGVQTAIFEQLAKLRLPEYFFHQNGRFFGIIPRLIDKSQAVEYLIHKYQPELTIGAGDSLTDLAFIQQCDFRIIPKQAQIETLLRPT